jgi:hypothetical protein
MHVQPGAGIGECKIPSAPGLDCHEEKVAESLRGSVILPTGMKGVWELRE